MIQEFAAPGICLSDELSCGQVIIGPLYWSVLYHWGWRFEMDGSIARFGFLFPSGPCVQGGLHQRSFNSVGW